MSAAAKPLGPYPNRRRQKAAGQLGMMVFLASEAMLFGAIIVALLHDRLRHPQAAAAAAGHLNLILGSTNTAVLLTSSLLVALAGVWARAGARRRTGLALLGAAGLGLLFLAIKASEYRLEFLDHITPHLGPGSPLNGQPAALFIGLYFIATSLHALHLLIGIVLLSWAAVDVLRRRLPAPQRSATLDLMGLYWHLVDIIWLFLFPLLYLARP